MNPSNVNDGGAPVIARFLTRAFKSVKKPASLPDPFDRGLVATPLACPRMTCGSRPCSVVHFGP